MPPNHHHVNAQKKQIFKKPLGVCSKNPNKKKKKDEIEIPCVSVPYLNDDIMRSIFMRVPAISLFHNCSFLSKHCSQLICNQNFIKTHLLQSNPGILLMEIRNDNDKVFKFMEFKDTQILKVHHLLQTSKDKLALSSNCGGLSIVSDRSSGNCHVLNLVTKQSIPLPTIKESKILVFDRANMNYKIVYFSAKFVNGRYLEQYITLLDLDGSCKRIKGPKNTPIGTPVLVNGVLYCDAIKKGLFCFHLSTETISYLRWPIDEDYAGFSEIMDLGGFVGFIAVDRSERINIWILREEKWVHRCCINKDQTLPAETRSPFFVGCLGSDEDLFVFTRDHNRLDAYNLKTKRWMMIKPRDNSNICRRGIHVTTIFPLPSKMVF